MCGSARDSNASGNACNSEVANKMPTERLTMRSTIFDSKANEKIAAAEMLKTPAMVVASKIESRGWLMAGLGARAKWLQIRPQRVAFGKLRH